MKKMLWLPVMLVVSFLITSNMIAQGYSSLTIFCVSLMMGGVLGFLSALMGYEA